MGVTAIATISEAPSAEVAWAHGALEGKAAVKINKRMPIGTREGQDLVDDVGASHHHLSSALAQGQLPLQLCFILLFVLGVELNSQLLLDGVQFSCQIILERDGR